MLKFTTSLTDDMTTSSLRVALINYILSQQRKENLIIHIEDMDKEKTIKGKDKEILDILSLFNISYSQVIYQSQNIRFYSAMALQLLHEKKAFSCFCSSNWLDKKLKEAKKAKKTYRYDDACKNLSAELVIDNTSPFTIRISKPENIENIDSFIIMNQDKTPTYNFACAVDDMLSDISIVIRDEDHMDDTLKQEHIRKSLNYDKKIEYVHLPIILSDNVFSVKWLLENGYLPEAISNYLILMGNKLPKEIFNINEATEWFDLSKMSKSPVHFDIDTLKHINKEHLKSLDAKELSRYVGFADEEIGKLAHIYLEEAGTTKELKAKITQIFTKRNISEEFAGQAVLMTKTIKEAPYFEEYNDFKNYVIKTSTLKEKDFVKLLRILLTNAEHGPDLVQIYKYLKNYIGEIIK